MPWPHSSSGKLSRLLTTLSSRMRTWPIEDYPPLESPLCFTTGPIIQGVNHGIQMDALLRIARQ